MIDRSRRVVLLIDYDNLQICASRDTPGRDLQLTPVVQLAQRYGTVILARAYAEWNLSTERLAVYKAGIEPAFAPVLRTESDRSGKSLADTVMVAEGMDMLWTLSPDVVVLATSDKDLIPLVRVAKQRGAFVVVLGSDFTAIPLREMADDHVTYRQLISDAAGRPATEAGPGRQPAALPEPPRRRTRDRTGRERAAAAPPSSTAQAPSRPEREPQAATTTPAAEPVAPVTSGTPGEADLQTGGRRRRRRGSRRRSDRLGAGSEVSSSTAADAETAEVEDEEDEITPTSHALDVARASDATVEPLPIEPAEEPAPPEATETPAPPRTPTRRRRTRRTTGTTEAEASAAEVEGAPQPTQAPAPSPVPEPTPTPVPEPSADILPAPPPEEASANGEAPKPARATRPRRVASASRGRVRRS